MIKIKFSSSKSFKMFKRKIQLFLIFSSFSINLANSLYLDSDEPKDFDFYSLKSKSDEKIPLSIARKLQISEIDDFCYIKNEELSEENCGCFQFDENYVVASAKCLME